MRHLINAVIFTAVYYFIGRDVALEQAAMFGGIYLVASILIERLTGHFRTKRMQGVGQEVGDLDVLAETLIRAVGGADNIESVDSETSRLKLRLVDVDQASQEALKKVATNGAYLSGTELQIPMADHAEQVADVIRTKSQ